MSAITWNDVLDLAPELTGQISALGQAGILAVANTQLKPSDWGGESSMVLKLGRVYLAAHHATLNTRGASPGYLTSESADGISRSYMFPTGLKGQYNTTAYGQLFAMMAKTRAFRAGFSGAMVTPIIGTGDTE